MNATKRGALTPWISRREGQVRTQKGSNTVRATYSLMTAWRGIGTRKKCDQGEGTHFLETTSGGTSKAHRECNRARGTHSLPMETALGGISQDT